MPIRKHLSLLGFLLLLGGLAWVSLRQVQFSASLFDLLPSDMVEVRGMDWLNRYFSRDRQLIVTVHAPDAPAAEQVSTDLANRLRNETELVGAVREELPLDQLATMGGGLLAWMWFNADPQEVTKLAGRLAAPRSGTIIAESMDLIVDGLLEQDTMIRTYDPLVLTRLPQSLRDMEAAKVDAMASADGTFRIFYVEGTGVDFSDYRQADEWLHRIKRLVTEWRTGMNLPQGVTIGLTGTPAFMAEVGTEMERDMTLSVVVTMTLISLLFWIMHRQSQPLGWLISCLCLVLVLTLSVGGLVFGRLSLMSAGFAAILLGLAVDYGIVLYREAMAGIRDTAMLRNKVGGAILWAALTTAVVFLSLNFSSLPGVREMGNLVAIGIGFGAAIMLFGFSIIAVQFGSERPNTRLKGLWRPAPVAALGLAVVIPLGAGGSLLVQHMPGLEAQFHPFRIRSSPSMKAWQQLQSHLRSSDLSVPLIVTGGSMDELFSNTQRLEKRLAQARAEGLVEGSILPFGLLPNPVHQKANLETVQAIVEQKQRLLGEIDRAGFSAEGARLTAVMIEAWSELIAQLNEGRTFAVPTDEFARWTVGRLFSAENGEFAALGAVTPAQERASGWIDTICMDGNSAIASLGSLGRALNERISRDLFQVFLPMIALMTVMLAVVFRSWKDWCLIVFSMFFSACVVMSITLWTPLSWNSFNICGVPLLFGTGLDFGIHMIFALRRSQGELMKVDRGIARALLFCGTSSAIGFGSLAFSSAHGLASLGMICATGIVVNMVVAVWLLPVWYRGLHGLLSSGAEAPARAH